MTVTSIVVRSSAKWTGVETGFPTGIQVQEKTQLVVSLTPTGGASQTLTSGLHYSVALSSTGVASVVPLAAFPATPGTVSFVRETPMTQVYDPTATDTYDAAGHAAALDRSAMRVAELSRKVDDVEAASVVVTGGASNVPKGTVYVSDGKGAAVAGPKATDIEAARAEAVGAAATATGAASTATTAAVAAGASATLADRLANAAPDTPVGSGYSARHWAAKAAAQVWDPANYAPLASPTFTGDPRGPTPAAGNNSKSFATTEFVWGERGYIYNSVSLAANTVLDASYFGLITRLNNTAAITVTLPAVATGNNRVLHLVNVGTAATVAHTITAPDGTMRIGGVSYGSISLYPGQALTLVGDGVRWSGVHSIPPVFNAAAWVAGAITDDGLISPAKLAATVGVVQSVSAVYSASTALTSVIPSDNTIPQITEGTQILSVTITPKLATSKLRVRFSGSCAVSAANRATAALFVNGAANAVDAVSMYLAGTGNGPLAMEYEFAPGSTTAQTIAVRVGPESGSLYMNNAGNTSYFTLGGIMKSMLVVEEVN